MKLKQVEKLQTYIGIAFLLFIVLPLLVSYAPQYLHFQWPALYATYPWYLAVLGGLVPVVAYYLWAWNKFGRDPRAGLIQMRTSPPQGISPAAARYRATMMPDEKAFAAALISLAIKGKITISEDEGDFTLTALDESSSDTSASLPPEEQTILDKLFSPGRRTLTLSDPEGYWQLLQSVSKALKQILTDRYGKGNLLSDNLRYIVIGALLTLGLTVAVAVYTSLPGFQEPFDFSRVMHDLISRSPGISHFAASGHSSHASYLIAIPFVLGYLLILSTVIALVRRARGGYDPNRGQEGCAVIVGLPFFIVGLIFTLYDSVAFTIFLFCAINLNFFLVGLLPAYTEAGRQVKDELEGFRRYLLGRDQVENFTTSATALQDFEQYLPYAAALDAEQPWGEQFAAPAEVEAGEYRPSWYAGKTFLLSDLGAFATHLSMDLGSAIFANSQHPSPGPT